MTAYTVIKEWLAAPQQRDAMPAVFVGHGSPMNGIQQTDFSDAWAQLGSSLARPRGILCVSAHWLTHGTKATAMAAPKMIYDFSGFPRELYEVSYPAPGDPELAQLAAETLNVLGPAALDHDWGLDHGAWTVLRRMFPEADIPVVQLSINWDQGPEHHLKLGRQLAALRDRGILIVGSGNVVHNLGRVDFSTIDIPGSGYDWALDFDGAVKKAVLAGDDEALIHRERLSSGAKLAVPSPDHYYPLLYTVGARRASDNVLVFNESAVGGSLTMTSYAFG
ncbi:MAG: 4,5-DOPA dioxygenase extradiol [Spirochaetes bacterium GWB1_59_5]|nr:MAG: 4,5-DOPA dioxygenase extradiol [Spirochaetes bacterium GWB1_59_5]